MRQGVAASSRILRSAKAIAHTVYVPLSLVEVTVVEADSSEFPATLRDTGCERLWALGELGILAGPLLGLFCSKRCPGEIVLYACDIARALRGDGIPVISGFHSPVEKKCLELLLRGSRPLVVCPARGIEGMRVPAAWRKPIDEGRLLVVSPFEPRRKRADARLAEHRNRVVTALAASLLVLHAAQRSGLERLCRDVLDAGGKIYAPDASANADLVSRGALSVTSDSLLDRLSIRRRSDCVRRE